MEARHGKPILEVSLCSYAKDTVEQGDAIEDNPDIEFGQPGGSNGTVIWGITVAPVGHAMENQC